MDSKQRVALSAQLAALSTEEINKLYKQASAVRKRMHRPNEPAKGRLSLDDIVLDLIGAGGRQERLENLQKGVVAWTGPKSARTLGTDLTFELDGQRAVVGDDVEIGLAADGRTWKLSRILPRRTKLSRPDVGNANVERVIVANVDVVAIVVSVVSPPLHLRLIDRYLIAIQRGGAKAILCVNKIDLLEHKEDLDLLDPYRQLGLPVYVCSCETGEGIQLIRDVLQGSVTAFVGHSGVGKSSVMNALYPDLDRDTGDVMRGYGRGAHTTTASQLFDVAGGTRLIDTPGIRSFGLWKMEPGELKWYFPEFEGIQCRFNDCSHSHEPGCGVRDAVDAGNVHAARFDTYLRLLAGE